MRYVPRTEDWYNGERYEDFRGVERLDNFMPQRVSGADRLVRGSTNDGETAPRGPARSNGSKGAQ